MWIKTVMEEIEAMDTKKTSTLQPRQANEEIIMILPEELKKYLLYLDMMQLEITKKKKMADETDSKKETAVICEQIDDLIHAFLVGQARAGIVDLFHRISHFLDKEDVKQPFDSTFRDGLNKVGGRRVAQDGSERVQRGRAYGFGIDDIESFQQVESPGVDIVGGADFHGLIAALPQDAR